VTVLDELALNYGVSIVLCTATQPALRVDEGFEAGLQGVRELAPDPPELYRQLRRVNVRHIGTLDDGALAGHLREREQVLCIVNNRRHARALFEAVSDETGAYHLTTLMCAKHRSQVLAVVRRRLKANLPCRLVSTSLIEAGVDIDLPTVLRAEAGLDSIAQAAGRCNREGLRPPDASEVLIFATDNPDWAPPPELKQFAQVFHNIQRHHGHDLLSLEAVRAYFRELYWQKGPLELDAHDLMGLLKRSKLDSLPFETLAERFKVIETAMRPVVMPYDQEARDVLSALEFAESCGGLARRLQPYLVQVPRSAYDALERAHAIQPVGEPRYGSQFMQLVNLELYDEQVGLRWDNPTFLRAESLII
jgi:CRISPR-associated endonuclease/helicase Cas3